MLPVTIPLLKAEGHALMIKGFTSIRRRDRTGGLGEKKIAPEVS